MISIIICSINPSRCEKTLKNFSETIGVEYEVIVFKNRQENWGICKVYNHCAEKAKYPYLCFVHEDVFIETKDWGKKIIEFIEKTSDCGVIGFAGGLQAQKNLSSFGGVGESRVNVYDSHNGDTNAYSKVNYKYHRYANPQKESVSKVLCVDGLFQFVKKQIWEKIRYDENTFTGFHFYDVDFSLAVSELYDNYVILNFDVFHDSSGNMREEYIKFMFSFQEKWKKKLPKNLTVASELKKLRAELHEISTIIDICKVANFDMIKYFKQILKINGICFFILTLIHVLLKKLKELTNVKTTNLKI
ncbi:MAG: glycosyltransferase family protein [Chitinispirillales bacterium]|jgi:hypothetical protein|nr:glycosyltransferase family protein [Chitinispirillales bacterium]